MKRKVFSLALIVLLLLCTITACNEDVANAYDSSIITDNRMTIGVLLSRDESFASTSQLIRQGVDYAHSLASQITLDKPVILELVYAQYDLNESSVSEAADILFESDVAAVICDGVTYDTTAYVCAEFADTNIPLLFLSSYCEGVEDRTNIFSISASVAYMSSCAAMFAQENMYSSCAVVAYDSNKYYSDFVSLYKSTIYSYTGYDVSSFYMNGEKSNYSPLAVKSGGFDYIFLLAPHNEVKDIVKSLRDNRIDSKIMLHEVINKAVVSDSVFDEVSFISNFELDSKNNVGTVFHSNFSEYADIKESMVSAASAYGHDAYMTLFESLRSFSNSENKPMFSATTVATEATEAEQITSVDYCDAIKNVLYYGATEIISFNDNSVNSTYIYVDEIKESDVTFDCKYNFGTNAADAE